MNIKKITGLDVISLIENATEIVRLKKYQSKDFIKKHLGLGLARSGFYGILYSEDEVKSIERDLTDFNSNEDITLLIEGTVILNKIPNNQGSGNIIYSGYGLLEVDNVVIYDGRLKNLADQVIDNGAGTTWNPTTGAVDLGGVLNNGTPSNNIYFIPSTGANIIRWGADYLGNLPVNEYGVSDYIARFDYVAQQGEFKIFGNSGHSGVHVGYYESQTSTERIRQYKDVAQITIQNTPGVNSSYTFGESDGPQYWRRDIWQSHDSNEKSKAEQSYSMHSWEVSDSDSVNPATQRSSVWVVRRADIGGSVRSADGSSMGIFMLRSNSINFMDGTNSGIMTASDYVFVGKFSGSGLEIGSNALSSGIRFVDGTNGKKGIKLAGYGETDIDSAAGANYSTLVNTSLVPKIYVDNADAINAAAIATNATNISSREADIAVNATAIATNTTNITSNDTDIATNASLIAANAAAISSGANVTTNLSEGTTTNTTVDVNSSDGTNATLAAASTTRAGVMTKAKFDEVIANTAKTGITSGQASAITANTAKVGITSGQASAITTNTAKTGITSAQASEITANTAKTGITSAQASAITANTAKTGITTAQTTKLSNIETGADVTDATNVSAAGALMKTGGTVSGNVNFADDVKAQFGGSNDLQIYHDSATGSSYIEDAGAGNLLILSNGPNGVIIGKGPVSAYERVLRSLPDGAVELYFNNAEKIKTTNTGVEVTGNVVVSGTVDGRDVDADGTKLDTIETNADVTDTANVVASLTAGTNVTIAIDGTISAVGGSSSPLTTKGDLYTRGASSDTRLPVGTNDQILIADNTQALGLKWADKQTLSKTFTLQEPTASDNITIFRTDVAITVQEVIAVSTGTNPSTTYQIRHRTNRNLTGNALVNSEVTTSVTSGDTATLNNTTIPADSWVWFFCSAASGTNVYLSIDIRYTED